MHMQYICITCTANRGRSASLYFRVAVLRSADVAWQHLGVLRCNTPTWCGRGKLPRRGVNRLCAIAHHPTCACGCGGCFCSCWISCAQLPTYGFLLWWEIREPLSASRHFCSCVWGASGVPRWRGVGVSPGLGGPSPRRVWGWVGCGRYPRRVYLYIRARAR